MDCMTDSLLFETIEPSIAINDAMTIDCDANIVAINFVNQQQQHILNASLSNPDSNIPTNDPDVQELINQLAGVNQTALDAIAAIEAASCDDACNLHGTCHEQVGWIYRWMNR